VLIDATVRSVDTASGRPAADTLVPRRAPNPTIPNFYNSLLKKPHLKSLPALPDRQASPQRDYRHASSSRLASEAFFRQRRIHATIKSENFGMELDYETTPKLLPYAFIQKF